LPGDRFIMDQILSSLSAARSRHVASGNTRPFVLLTWAQTMDGCIAAKVGVRTQISNKTTSLLSHHLRTVHDAILIGVDTLIADDPLLTARLPSAPAAPSPRPVVLDSSLRTPPSARLLERRRPILFAAPEVELPAASVDLKNKADIVHVPDAPNGHGRNLQAVLDELHHRDIASVMVEGGGRVLSSFLESHLADFIIITVAPTLFGSGVKAYSCTGEGSIAVPVCVSKPVWTIFDGNAVLSGEPAYPIPKSLSIEGIGAEKL
jgi:riboflavin-specific deaminase-like protein